MTKAELEERLVRAEEKALEQLVIVRQEQERFAALQQDLERKRVGTEAQLELLKELRS